MSKHEKDICANIEPNRSVENENSRTTNRYFGFSYDGCRAYGLRFCNGGLAELEMVPVIIDPHINERGFAMEVSWC